MALVWPRKPAARGVREHKLPLFSGPVAPIAHRTCLLAPIMPPQGLLKPLFPQKPPLIVHATLKALPYAPRLPSRRGGACVCFSSRRKPTSKEPRAFFLGGGGLLRGRRERFLPVLLNLPLSSEKSSLKSELCHCGAGGPRLEGGDRSWAKTLLPSLAQDLPSPLLRTSQPLPFITVGGGRVLRAPHLTLAQGKCLAGGNRRRRERIIPSSTSQGRAGRSRSGHVRYQHRQVFRGLP
jgi:hypothetical protein